MTTGDVILTKLNQFSSFSMRRKNLRSLAVAGLALSINLSALAEERLDNAPSPRAPIERGTPSGKPSPEMRDRWQNMSPEERAERRKAMREHWDKMPPEERSEMRRKMKEHWMKMPPEEREARRKAMREHWEKMSPEERDQFKRDMGKQNNR